MCNLHSNTTSHEAMRNVFKVRPDRMDLGNMPSLPAIYPKYEAPIVTVDAGGDRLLSRSHWGFLTAKRSKRGDGWNKPQAWNNTRDDKVLTSGLWKHSFERQRCLIPGTAFSEPTGRNPATITWFRVPDVEVFAFAGIWKHQKGLVGDTPVDGVFHSMLTTEPNAVVKPFHARMPVILAPDDYETWLSGSIDDAVALLRPFPEDQLEVIGSAVGLTEEPTPS